MVEFNNVNEVLDFAIKGEEEAAQFYTDLADKMERESMKKVFHDFALEEVGHKNKLLAIKEGKLLAPVEKRVVADLKMADYLVDIEPTPNMDYQDALILAMKKEKAAYKLYSDLANSADSGELRSTFLTLAQEEAKHKVRFEIEYDDYVMQEN